MKHHDEGFKFDFGTNVTILTSAAIGTHSKKLLMGIFTGVVIDETRLTCERGQKHISVHAVGDFSDDWEYPDRDEWHYEPKHHSDYKEECEPKHHCEHKEECEPKHHCEHKEECEPKHHSEHKDNYKPKHQCEHKEDYKSKHHSKHKKECEHHSKHKKECIPKHHSEAKHPKKEKEEKYVVLSLTRPSFPYKPGQIVYINFDQIVAASVNYNNKYPQLFD